MIAALTSVTVARSFDSQSPAWAFLVAALFFGGSGLGFLLSARSWTDRRRRAILPPPKTMWSGNHTVPHHPQDGFFFGYLLLSLAALAALGLGGVLLNLW